MKRALSIAVVILLLASVVMIHPVKAQSKITIVPDDYLTIQEAIDNAAENDSIFARKGIYLENITINKALMLLGENKETTIIKSTSAPVINIKGNQISVSNFTVLASESAKPTGTYQYDEATYPKTAIKLENSHFCNITNNIIKNSGTAIWIANATNNTLVSNIVSENFYGITLTDSSSNNTISKNSLTNNRCAIQLFGTGSIISNNMIKQNYIAYNEQGLYLQDALSDNYPEDNLPNYVIENLIEQNEAGISLMDSQGNFIYHNNFVGNIRQVTDAAPVAIVSFSVNVWDNGTTGNYWSNYNGTGNNKVGNMPYIINGYNQDNYPMLIPFEIPLLETSPSFLPNSPSPTQIIPIPPILEYPLFLILLIVLLCILVIGLLRKKCTRSSNIIF